MVSDTTTTFKVPKQSRTNTKTRTHVPYINSLDGLRALCALAVVFYHMNLIWCQGGLIGVSVLFVLSGYLATGGLLREFEQSGRISCGHYYVKRIKRLLPTCLAYVAIALAACTIFDHQLLTKMRPDIIPGLLMFINWFKIFTQQSYFAAAGAPSPMTHFWSLAIEFQFYLAWPPILYFCLRHKANKKQLIIGLAIAAGLSAAAMALLYVPEADPSRAYYGTDTRAQSLLVGCLLAFACPLEKQTSFRAQDQPTDKRVKLELSAAGATIALLVMMNVTNGYSAFSYWGGTLACSVLAAFAIYGLLVQDTVMGRILSIKPLVWIGKRSFAIYIWHYIIIELLTPRAGVNQPWYLILLELVLTLIAADISYNVVETPFRKHMVHAVLKHGYFKGPKARRRARRQVKENNETGLVRAVHLCPMKLIRTIASVAVLAVAIVGLITVPAEAAVGDNGDAQEVVSAATLKKPLTDGEYDVLFIGDSVSLGAIDNLNAAFPHGMVDAEVGRQPTDALAVYQGYAGKGVVGDNVVFSIGSNGYLTEDFLQQLVDAVGPGKQIWFVNDRVPKPWCSPNNTLLNQLAAANDNVSVIDWYDDSQSHNEWFWDDGTHLRPNYAQNFVDLIVNTMGYEVPTKENTTYKVIFLGDGVSIKAADSLSQAWPYTMIDCSAGRSSDELEKVWQNYVNSGTAGKRVVIALQADVPLSRDHVNSLLNTIGDDVEVWLVDGYSTASFADANNQILSDMASSRKNVQVIDWNSEVQEHPEYMDEIGQSLTDEGIKAYTDLMVNAVGDVSDKNGDDQSQDQAQDQTDQSQDQTDQSQGQSNQSNQ